MKRLERESVAGDRARGALGTRMRHLGVDEATCLALDHKALLARRSRSSTPLLQQGEPMLRPRAIVEGWAAQVRMLADGRRQCVQLFLPGDVVGAGWRSGRASPGDVVALTDVRSFALDHDGPGAPPPEALIAIGEQAETFLHNQVVRLGRQTAYERIGHFLLEMHQRLSAAGLCEGPHCPLALTQEMLADVLGLTSVHVNRTLQSMRREGMLTLAGGSFELLQPEELADMVDFGPARAASALR